MFVDSKFNCSTSLDLQFRLLSCMYFDYAEETKDYIFCTSKTMKDSYWQG